MGAGGGRDGEVHDGRIRGCCISCDEVVLGDVQTAMLSPLWSWSHEVRLTLVFMVGRLAKFEL